MISGLTQKNVRPVIRTNWFMGWEWLGFIVLTAIGLVKQNPRWYHRNGALSAIKISLPKV
jgi:hypothetical protein